MRSCKKKLALEPFRLVAVSPVASGARSCHSLLNRSMDAFQRRLLAREATLYSPWHNSNVSRGRPSKSRGSLRPTTSATTLEVHRGADAITQRRNSTSAAISASQSVPRLPGPLTYTPRLTANGRESEMVRAARPRYSAAPTTWRPPSPPLPLQPDLSSTFHRLVRAPARPHARLYAPPIDLHVRTYTPRA